MFRAADAAVEEVVVLLEVVAHARVALLHLKAERRLLIDFDPFFRGVSGSSSMLICTLPFAHVLHMYIHSVTREKKEQVVVFNNLGHVGPLHDGQEIRSTRIALH